MSITGFGQRDEYLARADRKSDRRHQELIGTYGSVEAYLKACKPVLVRTQQEDAAFKTYWEKFPEKLKLDPEGNTVEKFIEFKLRQARSGYRGESPEESNFLAALKSVANKCKLYCTANARSFPLDSEGTSYTEEVVDMAFKDYVPSVTQAFGGRSTTNMVMLQHPETKEVVAATSFYAFALPSGGFSISNIFLFADAPYRGYGLAEELDLLRDRAAMDCFPEAVKQGIAKYGAVPVVEEVNRVQRLTLGEILEGDAGGILQAKLQVIAGKQGSVAIDDDAFVYVSYFGKAPIKYLAPMVYMRTVNADGSLGKAEAPAEFPAQIMLDHTRMIAARFPKSLKVANDNPKDLVGQQIKRYEALANNAGAIPTVPREQTDATTNLWGLRQAAMREIFKRTDGRDKNLYPAVVRVGRKQYSALGRQIVERGQEARRGEPLTFEQMYEKASYRGVRLKRIVDAMLQANASVASPSRGPL